MSMYGLEFYLKINCELELFYKPRNRLQSRMNMIKTSMKLITTV